MMTILPPTTQDILCDLSHLGLLKISGADALTFLQGQVTNDVNLLTGQNAHLSAYCNAKGRMLALFLAFAHGENLYLQLPKSLIELISKRLKMYVLRSKVEIKDVSEEYDCLGVSGPNATSLLTTQVGDVPTTDFGLASYAQMHLLKLPTPANARFLVFVGKEKAGAFLSALQANIHAVSGDAAMKVWDYLDIQAGIPQIYPQTQEQFVPQMLNLDALGGINYKKGCYTGQEIVARTHYLGTVKRRMFLAEIKTESAPLAGDKISDTQGNEAGMVVRSAEAVAGSFDLLAELRLEAQAAGTVTLRGQPLNFKPLPYTLEN